MTRGFFVAFVACVMLMAGFADVYAAGPPTFWFAVQPDGVALMTSGKTEDILAFELEIRVQTESLASVRVAPGNWSANDNWIYAHRTASLLAGTTKQLNINLLD